MIKRVLIVIDDAYIERVVAYHLERKGFRVTVVGRGQEALFKCAEFDIDLIVLDLDLPDHDGRDVLRVIRQKSSIPVIVILGPGNNDDRRVGTPEGANACVRKPIDPENLATQVEDLLQFPVLFNAVS